MPLTSENHFICGLKKPDGTPDCKVEFYYNPGGPNQPPPEWPPAILAALTKIVAIVSPLAQSFTTFYCCDDHAIEGIKRGQHLPSLPPKVQAATEADMNAAKRGMAAVAEMKGKPS
jgi:hypothetical protein